MRYLSIISSLYAYLSLVIDPSSQHLLQQNWVIGVTFCSDVIGWWYGTPQVRHRLSTIRCRRTTTKRRSIIFNASCEIVGDYYCHWNTLLFSLFFCLQIWSLLKVILNGICAFWGTIFSTIEVLLTERNWNSWGTSAKFVKRWSSGGGWIDAQAIDIAEFRRCFRGHEVLWVAKEQRLPFVGEQRVQRAAVLNTCCFFLQFLVQSCQMPVSVFCLV